MSSGRACSRRQHRDGDGCVRMLLILMYQLYIGIVRKKHPFKDVCIVVFLARTTADCTRAQQLLRWATVWPQ